MPTTDPTQNPFFKRRKPIPKNIEYIPELSDPKVIKAFTDTLKQLTKALLKQATKLQQQQTNSDK